MGDIDNHKLMFHPERVAEFKEKGDCPPIYVEIGLTNICNHRCMFCGLDWARGEDTLNTEILLKNLEDMKKFGVKSICFSGAGEPLLHKDFCLIIRKTKEYGIDVSFSTNGVLFDEKKAEETMPYLSWIRFSLDAGTPQTHAKIHGTSERDFQTILHNIEKAAEIKRKKNYPVTLGIQFLLLNENVDEILRFAEICREIGADNLQIKPYSQNPNSINRLALDYGKFNIAESELEKFSTHNFKVIYRRERLKALEKAEYEICLGLPFFAIINEKGDVAPCHLYYNKPSFSYGNIYKSKFSEIWKSNQRQEILKKIHEFGVKDCKKGCRLDVINTYLHRLKNPEFHDNFI